MRAQKIMLRRMEIQGKLENLGKKEVSVRIMAREMKVEARIVRSDLEWLRANRGMIIEKTGWDTVEFQGMSQIPLTKESRPGRTYPTRGLCDNCGTSLLLDGHRRFCGDDCRVAFMMLDPRERERLEADNIMGVGEEFRPGGLETSTHEGLQMPTPEEFAERSRKARELMKRPTAEPGPNDLDVEMPND